MTLPSQNDRSGELGRLTRADNKKGMDPAMIALGVLLAVGATVGVYALIKNNGKQTNTNGEIATNTPGSGSSVTSAPLPGATGTNPTGTPTTGTNVTGSNLPGTTPEKPVTINQGSKPLNESGATNPVAGANATNNTPGSNWGTTPGSTTTGATTGTNTGAPNGTTSGTTGAAPTSTPAFSSVLAHIEAGDSAMSKGNPVAARAAYSKALLDAGISNEQAAMLRDKVGKINDDLLFSSKITAGDPMVEQYTIASGDKLITIAKKLDLTTDWRLIQRVNGIKNPGAIRIGQKLKIVRGPFHAVVNKADYRLDLFAGSPDEPDQWTFIKSFKVGLGEGDSTPVGNFVLRANSKLVNPTWVNPRNPAERYAADDPKNPIGEYWMGIDGVGDSAQYKGFGIHGTIDPASIGQQKSMGCVRLGDEDVKLMYELLTERISIVQIKP
ncbi:MAG: L,D-transpeptidase family protein [Planctomycetes bacterium]|nr:L,D-transpeptidase family protein [Planctomycetota bacterium]